MSALPLLDPTLDVVFKLLLTSRPESREVLEALLTAVLRPKKPFKRVTVRNPELVRDAPADRGAVLDIFAELADGTRSHALRLWLATRGLGFSGYFPGD
jgi:hypothetical protein